MNQQGKDLGTLTVNVNLTVVESSSPLIKDLLTRIEKKLDAAVLQEKKQMAALDEKLATLTSQVEANTSVTNSAKIMIGGFAQLLADAIAAAQGAGATEAQLASLVALEATIKSSDEDLAAAIAARTPAQP